MARKRDYKAEYARRKETAKRAGYGSVKEYSAVRKRLGLGRGVSPISRPVLERQSPGITSSAVIQGRQMTQLRRESAAWSKRHSHQIRSRYSPQMTDAQVRKYHHAFVEKVTTGSRRERTREKRNRIKNYLVPDWIDEKEWKQLYRG